MPTSKRTQRQIQNINADKYNYVGSKEVALKLKEVEMMPSTLETIDGAVLKYIDENLNLSVTTNEGFKKVPVLWVTSERAFQLKHNKDLRDKEQTLILPLITINRSSVTKDINKKGTVYANLFPVPGPKGSTITVARRIKQSKTAEFQNAQAARTYGPDGNVTNPMKNSNKRNMPVQKVVYETISIPIPTWITVNYEITLRTEYQQQLNQLIAPFIAVPGNSRMPARITNENHFYEVFIDGNFVDNSNKADIGMVQRNYENTIKLEVLGYLMGEGENQEKPKIVTRENAVEFKMARERVILGDIPENIKNGFYRE